MDIYGGDMAAREGRHHCYFEQSLDYLFDVTGRNRVGILSRLEREEWYSIVYINIASIYAFCDRAPVLVDEVRIDPERGAVGGLVFVDYNANGVPDPGEPGLEGVKVVLNRIHTCVTDRTGRFVLPGIVATSEARVSLSLDTVPAIYVPTNGTQKAVVHPRRMAEVNLGVAPAVSLAGTIKMADLDDRVRGLPGIRITLITRDKGVLVADSVTATDGTFYIGDLLPGRYVLRVDTELLPNGVGIVDVDRDIEIEALKEPQDLQLGVFYAYPTSRR